MIGTLVGQYRLKSLLGTGGMGAVYLAEHEVLKTHRAVKILLSEWRQSQAIVDRFVNEARAAARIVHRNVVGVHDVGQLPTGEFYILYDYIPGGTLSRMIASHGAPLAPEFAFQLIAGVLAGVDAAHRIGIIHRDIKPDNVLVAPAEGDPFRPFLGDFGVAKLTEEMVGSSTRSGTVIGTPSYMAPEQLIGGKVGPASDVYAVGVVFYEMVTGGWLPYRQADESTRDFVQLAATLLYHRQMSRPPTDPRERNPALSPELSAAVLKLLDLEPTARPATARDAALLLAGAIRASGLSPDGTEILRRYTPELLRTGIDHATIRAPIPTPTESESKYQLGEKLGAGGMGEVFRATMVGEAGFSRPVAIKRVLQGIADEDFGAMFVREAQIASRLNHANIVSVLDFSKDSAGRLFLVMELVEGKDLARLMQAGQIPPSVAIYIATEILRGLGFAHHLPASGPEMQGIVHRDVSPQNVLLSWEGSVKVSDFGLAKAFAGAGTRTVTLKGRPQYFSPEQANGEKLDGRSDLFAVGILMWEILAGRPLFSGTAKEMIAQVLFREIPRPSTLQPGIPADLEAVVMKLLERELPTRFQTAEQAVDALARCANAPTNGRGELTRLMAHRFPAEVRRHISGDDITSGQRVAAVMTAAEPKATYLGGALVKPASMTEPPSEKKRSWVPAAIGIGGALVGVVVTLALTSRSSSKSSEPVDAGVAVVVRDAAAAPVPVPVPTGVVPPPVDAAVAVAPVVPPPVPVPVPVDAPPPPPPVDAGVPVATVAAAPKRKYGVLKVIVDPYAEVWIDGRSVGATPVEKRLVEGRHKVLLVNKERKRETPMTVTITADKTTVIEESW